MPAFHKMLFGRMILMMLFYQACRFFFLLFNVSLFQDLTIRDFVTILLGSWRFDASAIMYLNAVYIAIFLLPFRHRYSRILQKTGKWLFLITNGVGLLANLADIGYYPFLLRRTNAAFFLEFQNDANLLFAVSEFIYSYKLLSAAGVVMLYFFYKSYAWIKTPKAPDGRQATRIVEWILLPLVVLLWLGLARGSFRPENRPINISYAGDYVRAPAQVNLVINTPFSIMMTWGNIKVADVNYFSSLGEAAAHYNPEITISAGKQRSKNVVILIVESLSKEFVGALNKDKPGYRSYTPFLDSLIDQSLVFETSFANGKRSIEALPAVVAGIPSPTEAFVLTPYSGNTINSLGTVLQKRGYHTSFFHGASEGSMGFSAFMKMAGFRHMYSRKEYDNDRDFDGMWGIWDEPFLQFWAQQLNSFREPFCSVLFTVSSHHPYKLPELYRNRFPAGPLEIHSSIAYADYAIAQFFKTAEKMPWYKSTVFVITADHTATFAHEKSYQTPVGAFEVPVIFFTPDTSLTGFSEGMIQHTDIFPTLLSYLGSSEKIIAFGQNALDTLTAPLKINCYGGVYQVFGKEFLLRHDGTKVIGLYRYKKDVFLTENLIEQEPVQRDFLRKKLEAFMQQYAQRLRQNKLTAR